MFKIFAMPLLAITIITWNTTAWGIISDDQIGTEEGDCSIQNSPLTFGYTDTNNGGKNCSTSVYMCNNDKDCILSCTGCSGVGVLSSVRTDLNTGCSFQTCSTDCSATTCATTPINVVGWQGYMQSEYVNQSNCTCSIAYSCAEGYIATGLRVSCSRDFNTGNLTCSGCQANEPETPSCDAGQYLSTSNSCVKCTTGYYCTGDNNRTPCPGDYPNSEAGATSINSCYTNITRICTQNEGSTPPSGCASVTAWNECSCRGETYKKYANSTTSGTTTNETCTKTPKTVTASANHYVSGTTCPACDSDYPYSDGGSIGSGSCYGSFSKSGSQVECSPTSDNVVLYTCASSCTPGSCTYTRYFSGDIREDTCVPTNCTKDLVSVTCKSGYYPRENDKKCILCTEGYYCDGSGQTQCPEIESRPGERGTSKEGSTSKGDCYVPGTPEPLTAEDATGTYVCISDAYYQTGTN